MKTHKLLSLGFLSVASLVHAAPPTSGAYTTDPQSEYVQDQTSEGLTQANSILCYMANTRPDSMVNKGKYVAFIDESKCDTSSRDSASNSSSEGGGQTTKYTRMSLTSTRSDNTSAQSVKGHASINMGGNLPTYVYINASSTEAPSATAPNGAVTMNLGGLTVANNTKVLRGKISASGTTVSFSWAAANGQGGGENYRLYVDGNDSAGSGAIVFPKGGQSMTLTFGYNSTHFCRSDGTTERCFLRSKDQAKSAVWRYGVYDDSTGARYDIAQPGIPVKNDANGEYGFASYWGIWFPTAVADGATIKSADGANSYTVFKSQGRLIKYSKVPSTLDAMSRVPFNVWVNVTIANKVTQNTSYEIYWDKDNANFVVSNAVTCGQGGCFKKQISSTTLTPAELKQATGGFGAMGWSEALGGQLMVPKSALDSQSPGAAAVAYNTQSTVLPGDTTVPASLKCARDCTDATLLASPGNDGVPYSTNTYRKGGGVLEANLKTYTWDSGNYQLKDGGVALSNANLSANMNAQFKGGGIRTGALVDATGTAWTEGGAMDCGNKDQQNRVIFCDFKANAQNVYYVWENGSNDWNSATFLKKADNTFIVFTPPQSAAFSVPNDAAIYGEFAGANMNLQFGGFGNLWGIPGKCFSPQTNQPADCSSATRFVPAFSIPVNTASSSDGKVTINNATKWVKFLDREIRFKLDGEVGTNGYSRPAGITLGTTNNLPAALSLNGSDAEDPSDSANTNYAGSVQASDFKSSPSVIHGVVQ